MGQKGTRKERKQYAKTNRKIFSIIMIVGGFFSTPYFSSFIFQMLRGLLDASGTNNINFGYFYNFSIPFKYLLRNIREVEDLRIINDGLAITMLSFIMFAFVVIIALLLHWRTHQLKKFSGEKNAFGTPESSGNGEHGTTRFQTEKEKNDSTMVWETTQELTKAGVLVGSKIDSKGKEIFNLVTDDSHCIEFATTRLGKTRREVLPLIWTCSQAGESMIINDPKGELYANASSYLTEHGYNVICVNFREPLKGNYWNQMWLVNLYINKANECKENIDKVVWDEKIDPEAKDFKNKVNRLRAEREGYISKATEVAGDLSHSLANQSGAKTSAEPIWENGEKSVIQALILLVAMESKKTEEKHLTSVYHMLAEYGVPDDEGEVPLNTYIETLEVDHPARRAYAVAKIAPSKTRGSFFTQALTDLRLFADPEISDMCSTMDHDMFSFGVEKTAVFMIVPDDKKNRNVLASIYADQAYVANVQVANKYGGRLPIRIRNIYDEFGNMPPIVDFESKITVAGGRGILYVLILQNYSQLEALYGDHADTIIGNCHTWLYQGTHEPKVAKMISEMTGTYTVESDGFNASFQQNSMASVGSSTSLGSRALLTPDEVIKWDKKNILVFRIGHYPSYYPLGDISLFKANLDYGFLSLKDSKEMIEKIVSDTQKLYLYFPKISNLAYDNMCELAMVVKNEVKNYDDLDYASKSSQFISISKWDSVSFRSLKKSELFNIPYGNSTEVNKSDEEGENLMGTKVVYKNSKTNKSEHENEDVESAEELFKEENIPTVEEEEEDDDDDLENFMS